jgi:hypothetical protein
MPEDDDQRTITVERRVRPLRLAFLIERDNRRQALEALETCSILWGGPLCPIIPVYRGTPLWLSEMSRGQSRGSEATRGWIDTFEPDYLVELRPGLAGHIGVDPKLVISANDLLESATVGTGYSISGRDVLATAYEQVYRFARRHPEPTLLCDPKSRKDELWVSAVFGCLRTIGASQLLREAYEHTCEPEQLRLDGENFGEVLFRPAHATPLSAMLRGLELKREINWRSIYLLFDPTEVIDVLHLWNLRAFGLPLYPVPLPYLAQFCKALEHAIGQGFMRDARLPHPIVLSPAPTVSSALVEEARATVADLQMEHPLADPVAGSPIRTWSPDDIRDRRLTRMSATASESTVEVISRHRHLRVDCPQPDVRLNRDPMKPSAWATVVRLRDERVHSELAEVYPPDVRDVDGLLSQLAFPDPPVTSSSEGLVIRCGTYGEARWWVAPTGTELFVHWLASRGVRAELSAAGRATEEFNRVLGGPNVSIHVGAPDLVRLIGEAVESRSGVITYSSLMEALGRWHQGNRAAIRGHLDFLTRKVLQIQMSARCPTCEAPNWYEPQQLAGTLRCTRCLRDFPFPATPPHQREWGYRPIGPFAGPGYAHGAYAVSLALRFFLLRGSAGTAHSWTVSLEQTKSDKTFEVDFGLWLRPEFGENQLPQLIFGEAKTFNRFERVDFQRASTLLTQFPAATMVFATLRASLDPDERASLRRLLGRQPRLRNRGRIVILTAAELCDRSGFAVPHIWKGHGERAEKVAELYRGAQFELPVLSDATLDLYADWRP